MAKQIKSKLDQFAAQLLEMDAAGKTLAEMLAWLKEESCTVALSTLSRWLESARSQEMQDKLLAQISSGAAQCRAVQKQFGENAPPEIETLIKIHRVLILKLATAGQADPELLKLADTLMRSVMEFVSGQTKAAFKERELSLDERKYEETKKDEQAKALEMCLEEARALPAVQALFKQAFAALKEAKVGVQASACPPPLQISNG